MKLIKTWETKIKGIREGNTRRPVVYNDIAIFSFSFRFKSFYKSKIVAFSTVTNSLLWQKELDHIITPLLPHPTSHAVLATTMGGEILYLDMASGKELWKTAVKLNHCNLFGANGIVNGIAIIPETAGNSENIYGVDIRNGDISWQYNTGNNFKVATLLDEQLYGLTKNNLVKIDATSGDEIKSIASPKISAYDKAYDFDEKHLLVVSRTNIILINKNTLEIAVEEKNHEEILPESLFQIEGSYYGFDSKGHINTIKLTDKRLEITKLNTSYSDTFRNVIELSENLIAVSEKEFKIIQKSDFSEIASKKFSNEIDVVVLEKSVIVSQGNGLIGFYSLG